MKTIRLASGMFVAIFITLAGIAKLYETIAQTFVPNYGAIFRAHSLDLHFGFALIAAGLTVIWRLWRY